MTGARPHVTVVARPALVWLWGCIVNAPDGVSECTGEDSMAGEVTVGPDRKL